MSSIAQFPKKVIRQKMQFMHYHRNNKLSQLLLQLHYLNESQKAYSTYF